MEQHTDDTTSNAAPCPSCGEPAPLGAESAYVDCETCGIVPLTRTTMTSAELEPEVMAPEPLPVGAVRCQWCGAANPPDVERCVRCNAAFPKPEMDLAMLKAAEDRLRVLEDEITLRENQRKSGIFGKLFG